MQVAFVFIKCVCQFVHRGFQYISLSIHRVQVNGTLTFHEEGKRTPFGDIVIGNETVTSSRASLFGRAAPEGDSRGTRV